MNIVVKRKMCYTQFVTAIFFCFMLSHVVIAQSFIEQSAILLPAVTKSSVSWGDYDNNGTLDFILTGETATGGISKIFSNNGDNTFTELPVALTGVLNGSVSCGDYNNDGYIDILLCGSISNTVAVTKIYKNNGNSTFTEQTGIILPALFGGSIAWGDYDNDGYLDILLTGYTLTGTTAISAIYHNNGNNTFTESGITLTGVANGNAVWGDYNNDDYLDIVLTGSGVTKIYLNNGNGNFAEQTGISLLGLTDGNVAWGDYNNDGYLDILLHGKENEYSVVYKNNGDNTFTALANVSSKKNQNGSISWGDYDNDGYLDILITGKESGMDSKVFRNNHDGTFSEVTGNALAEVEYGAGIWGDYNNDGKLDILLTGSGITKLYRNIGSVSNTPASAPTNLQTSVSGSNVTFTWDKALDTETLQDGLSYNLYVYEDGQTTYKRTPHAFTQGNVYNGRRLIAQIGSIQYCGTGYTIKDLPLSSYKWSIQAVDAGLLGGSFATEATFSSSILGNIGVNVANGQITNTTAVMSYSLNSTNGIDGTWTLCTAPNTNNVDFGTGGFDVWVHVNGLGILDKRKIATIAPQAVAPIYSINYANEITNQSVVNTDEYSVNPDITGATTGSGVQINVDPGHNLYFRTKATAGAVASAIQTLLVANRPVTPIYSIDYYNETTNEIVPVTDEYLKVPATKVASPGFISGTGAKIVVMPGETIQFRTKATDLTFKSLIQSIVLPYRPATPIYTINYISETTTENVTASVEFSTDSLMTSPSAGTGTKITVTPGQQLYFRVKATSLTFKSLVQTLRVAGRPSTPVYSADMINETTKEVVPVTHEYSVNADMSSSVSGTGVTVTVTPGQNIYFRVKSTSTNFKSLVQALQVPHIFTDQTGISLPGVFMSSAAWGDYDNDGYLDVLLTGLTSTGEAVSKIYHNNGDNTFAEQTGSSLVGVSDGSSAWGDYNNDGYLDILLTGWSGSADVTKIYRNNGDRTFTEETGALLPGVSMSSVAWADCDNDGFPDILLTGSSAQYISKVFHNNGNNTFTELTGVSLTGVYNSSVAWGDYNNDGFLDILLTGDTGSARVSKIYRNDGNNTFTEQTEFALTGVSDGSVAWGDCDNDGYLDIVLTGTTGSYPPVLISKIYHNNNGLSFAEITGSLSGVYNGSVTWGDYDNDGLLDILLTGRTGSVGISKVYRNNGNNTFTEQTRIILPGLYYGMAVWGDYDNDDNLDILLTGNTSAGRISKIYHNNRGAVNAIALVPGNLQTVIKNGTDVTFTWSKTTDNETPQNGLTYNLYVYQTGFSNFKRSPYAFTQNQTNNGHRLIAQLVNIQYDALGYTLRNLPTGSYKWSVQAIDGGLKGGSFAPEATFDFENLSNVHVNVAFNQIIGTTNNLEYSINSTDGINGTWIQCENELTNMNFGAGGFNVWIRQKGVPTNYFKIATIPAQAPAPLYTIDYVHETTKETCSNNDEYSLSFDMNGAISGNNIKLSLTPGQNLYLRTKATINKVNSAIRLLVVANRPLAPGYTINYANESINESISLNDEYSVNPDMVGALNGTGKSIKVIPGQNLYFRTRSTNTTFSSTIQTLVVKDRPAAPTNALVNDFSDTFYWNNSSASNNVTDYEFSLDSGRFWTTCIEKPLYVGNINKLPGSVQVRIKTAENNFASDVIASDIAFTSINTGIHDYKANIVRLYPNPAADIIVIDGIAINAEVTIYSLEGMIVKSVYLENTNSITVNELSSGMYILKIRGDKVKEEIRFIKQ
jgi:hypothetical protein